MTQRPGIPDFKAATQRAHTELDEAAAHLLLDAGRAWDLAPALRARGALIFPHVSIGVCGHHIASVIHACLDSGAPKVLAWASCMP